MDTVRCWIQITNLGLELFGDKGGIWAWVTDLAHTEGAIPKVSIVALDSDHRTTAKNVFTNVVWDIEFATTLKM